MNSFLRNNKVAVFYDQHCVYSQTPPFHPNQLYPEYPFGADNIDKRTSSVVDAYMAVRNVLMLQGLDSAHQETEQWNPLGFLIQSGQTVVIKPNFVLHRNDAGHDVFANITHPAVIRAVIDYCYIALQGRGSVCIADAPQMDCEWDQLMTVTRLQELVDFYSDQRDFSVILLDLRRLKCRYDAEKGIFPAESFVIDEQADPLGSTIVDLGSASWLHGLPALENLYGADYDRRFTSANHNQTNHRYSVSNTILKADAVICIPKLKTHKKVGVTLNIKLLVGLNTDKNYLAHYRVGSPAQAGDEFPDAGHISVAASRKFNRFLADHFLKKRTRRADVLTRMIRAGLKPIVRLVKWIGWLKEKTPGQGICQGNWHGNDTAWRMALDLAKIFVYADSSGQLAQQPQRRIFSIIDGIVAGEGEGPLAARPLEAGTVVAGENILAVDSVATAVMGFDYSKVKMLNNAWSPTVQPLAEFKPDDIIIASNHSITKQLSTCRLHSFIPHSGWQGHIELDSND